MSDYQVYNEQYQRMENMIAQIQNYGDYANSLKTSSFVGGLDFLSLFQNASSRVDSKVSAPESMDAIFEEAAAIYRVPANLLKAIGKAESGFDASAVSAAGAQGVMQLMPATAEALGVSDPFDARSNIMGGAKYISDLLQRYGGDVDLALAAYNAGSGNVAKYGGVPPFEETMNYIKRIKEYMGTDLTAEGTVGGSFAQGVDNLYSAYNTYNNSGIQFSKENALYLVELLKIQMQNKGVTEYDIWE